MNNTDPNVFTCEQLKLMVTDFDAFLESLSEDKRNRFLEVLAEIVENKGKQRRNNGL